MLIVAKHTILRILLSILVLANLSVPDRFANMVNNNLNIVCFATINILLLF